LVPETLAKNVGFLSGTQVIGFLFHIDMCADRISDEEVSDVSDGLGSAIAEVANSVVSIDPEQSIPWGRTWPNT
jgi:hypothetical protein